VVDVAIVSQAGIPSHTNPSKMIRLSCNQRPISLRSKRMAVAAHATETDYLVIGSGIGGLSCGALLAKYGEKVTVLESHTVLGGAAHSYQTKGYHFESGPSLYSEMASRGKEANPLAHVLQAIGEDLDLISLILINLYSIST
jgi:NADPH-dependent 2,4-dienoyl-CoA reductase/sulfur reductase-like enzyme